MGFHGLLGCKPLGNTIVPQVWHREQQETNDTIGLLVLEKKLRQNFAPSGLGESSAACYHDFQFERCALNADIAEY